MHNRVNRECCLELGKMSLRPEDLPVRLSALKFHERILNLLKLFLHLFILINDN